MRRPIVIALSAGLVIALGTGAAGCTAPSGSPKASDRPPHAPALMPASHEGRFAELGAQGCYGCHGSSERADPLLASAPKMPADHYLGGSVDSREIDPVRTQCDTCHGQE